MRPLLVAIAIAAALLAAPVAAQTEAAAPADDAAVRLELSRRFIAALQAEQMGTMIGQMVTGLTPPTEGMSDAQQASVRAAVVRASTEIMPEMFDAMAPVYAELFSREELTAIVTFYESDVARSMIAKSYAATPRLTEIMVGMMPRIVHRMSDVMCEELQCTAQQRAAMDAELARKGYPRPSADQ